eukprot:11488468-Ditylum_brightwellii.AAC.1
MKFPVNETVSSKMLGKAIKSKMVGVPPNIYNTAFCEFFKILVSKSLSKLRHDSQILVRKNCTVDAEKGSVPISLPDNVEMVCTDNGIISAEYRNYSNADNEDFYYFVTRILFVINPANNNFKQRKDKDLISDIFLGTDKAFGLMII